MHSQIIEKLKASGIFDQFRKECIADVDTKPAYINLHSRVVQSVDDYLKNVHWSSKLVRFGVREGMRKQIVESSYFQKGVDRIVNQTVDPKINTSFLPVIENAVYEFLGVQKPCGEEPKEESEEDKKCWVQPMDIDPPQDSNGECQDVKPNLAEPPDQVEDVKVKTDFKVEEEEETNEGNLVIVENQAQEEEKMEEEDDEEESPPFEAIGLSSPLHPLPVSAVPMEEVQKPVVSEEVDVQVTDFTNCFAKPVTDKEQLSNDSSELGDSSVFTPNPSLDKKESSKTSSSKESSSKDRSSSSSASKKSSDKDRDKPSSSSSKDRSRSSSHSHSKSKSKYRDHSSSRDREKNYSDRSNDRDKDSRSKKESSSSKSVSKSSSDSKHSRSSHSSSSRRHSSTSHSKDNRSNSDRSKTSDDKSSSKYKDKDYKVSSSQKESSRSHSSSSKDQDRNKHSSSSRKSSSSRSGHDHKSSRSKSSSKYDKDKSDSHRSSDESSNKAKNYETVNEELPSKLPPPPPVVDSPPSVQEQMSPDVNEGGLIASHAQYHGSSSPKIISDHEESALDKWYGSGVATGDLVSFSNSKLEPPSGKLPDELPPDVETVSSTSPVSDREDNSNYYAYSPSIPCQSEVQLASKAGPCPEALLDVPTSRKVPEDTVIEREPQNRHSKAKLINSLQDIAKKSSFVEKRKYLFELMDPFYDERDIPVSPPTNLPKPVVTIENCNVNNTMIKWLQRKGARVHLRK